MRKGNLIAQDAKKINDYFQANPTPKLYEPKTSFKICGYITPSTNF